MSFKMVFFIIFIAAVLLMFTAWQLWAYNVSEPDYKVVRHDREIELRQYPAMIVASVNVSGERYEAINKGFRLLADYIFGNNRTKKQIPMTAPVVQQGEKIPMTAPVIQSGSQNTWTVEFVMPAGSTLSTLPEPNNTSVKLITVPPRLMAVIRFSGSNTDANLEKHLTQLNAYINQNKMKVIGAPIFAFYNPPWILPIFRRNEIMIEVHPAAAASKEQ